MKNRFLKFYIVAFYLGSTFMLFAQPGLGSNNGGIDDAGANDNTPAAPIDNYVWIMTFVALTLAFLKFSAMRKKSNFLIKQK